MDPTTLTIGGLAALAAFNGMQWYFARRDLKHTVAKINAVFAHTFGCLRELRMNCFITNERGHRVRYVNASQEARAKAEGSVQ